MLSNQIIKQSFAEIMGKRFGDYANLVILSRAIPDARDGLKPVQRRILYAMYQEGNTNDKPYRKSAKTVGYVMGTYHPHGDSAIYETMVRMAQWWKMRQVLIQGHGNFGSLDADPPAAMRYTESRLSALSNELLRDIEKETVTFIPNYDNSAMQPAVLPARFPNLLVNGASGIAVGFATDIPTHNLGEVIDAAIAQMKNPNITLDELMQLVKGPDFPTGAIVQGLSGIRKAFETGRGQFIIRAKTHVEEPKGAKVKKIVVSEIPYEVVKSKLVAQIDELVMERKIEGAIAVRDETGRKEAEQKKVRIVVDIRKEADEKAILNYLYKNTDLQIYYNYNMNVIHEGTIRQMGLKALLAAYVDHQKEVVTNRSQYDLNKKQNREHIVQGLIRAKSILREIVDTIMDSEDRADAKRNIMEKYGFTDVQADAILNIQLASLTRLDIVKLEKELATLAKEIEELKAILGSEKKLIQVITGELNEIKKKYAEERLTEIQGEIEEIKIDIAMQINAEDCIVTLTNEGYIKRTSPRSFKSVGGTLETCGVKEGDRVRYFVETNTSHTALFFTHDGKYFATLVNAFPDDKWKDIGSALVNVIPLEKQQRIVGFTIVENFKQELYVYHVSKSGLVKKTALSEYETNRSSALVAAKLKSDEDEFVHVFIADEAGGILGATKDGMGIRFMRSEVSTTGRASSGVKAISLGADDEVITMLPIEEEDKRAFSLVTTDGVLKRTAITDIPLQGRAGKGVTLIRKRKSNPHQLLAITIEDTMYAWIEQNEWVLIDKELVIVNEQGGIGRTVIEGGLKAIAFETILPTDEAKDDGSTKASGEGAASGGSSQKTPNSGQSSLFDE
ncbi:DNA topoisomerase 4 subunit A [Brevibacillus reuszeri]|uniref:DNA topoisomerase (ATP-hydrolyzing) n=1 Tax=Brevibacillus reuszeri TaxID=54915 RepID=A0A0K9YND0_9BACL|nr:DNA topoisomerase IV subunit A [Brevibacillus reuszeri]KNB70248.1 DNA gyrase subunit A [Brevibacillus reuszeri]MED1859206.1 DNA topoisomerase IV subunit A [Brevibacillus reuszeri]GED72298.1 DNA topoisomerase 4 subunit A [Brevibacillus reuszeri]